MSNAGNIDKITNEGNNPLPEGEVPSNPDFDTAKIGDVPGGDYTNFEPDGTAQAKGDATCWDDIRVGASKTEANGSNPPTDALFKNDGNEIPGDAYALSFLSTTQGNLNLPDVAVFDTSQDFTFEFWFRPVVGTQVNIELVRKQSVFDIDYTGADQLTLDVGGVGAVQGSVAFNRGAWNHCAIVHSTTDTEIRMFINAQLAATLSGTPSDNSNEFKFNRQETLYDVDYVAYWDKVLLQADINGRYASGAGAQLQGNEVGLKGLWELNDGSGTAVVEKTGIALDGDISGGSEGVQWAWIGGHVGNTSAGSRGVILKYFSPDIENEVYFELQVPHRWKEGSTIYPHIHWVPNNNGGVGENARWGFEYTWSNIGGTFGDTATIYSNDTIYSEDLIKGKHYISALPTIDGTGKTISSMLVCRLFRDADDAADTYTDFAGFLEFDVHMEIDMLGSREEFVK